MVVYYTGTGNSRYVAQRFAAALGDDLITANEYIKNDTPAALHSDRPWVFVSPTYGWQIPHIFADFLRRGSFTGSREAYFVMTCGSEIGNAGSRIAALCADIGLSYRGVPLRYNYDKPEKPRISRVFGYLARFFILFQTEKSSREVVIS